jgi:hypothetical protein
VSIGDLLKRAVKAAVVIGQNYPRPVYVRAEPATPAAPTLPLPPGTPPAQPAVVVEPVLASKSQVAWAKVVNALNGKKLLLGALILYLPDILHQVAEMLIAAGYDPAQVTMLLGKALVVIGVGHKLIKVLRALEVLPPLEVPERRQADRREYAPVQEDPIAGSEAVLRDLRKMGGP